MPSHSVSSITAAHSVRLLPPSPIPRDAVNDNTKGLRIGYLHATVHGVVLHGARSACTLSLWHPKHVHTCV